MNQELPDVQAGLEKMERNQIANINWITENCVKFLKDRNTRPPDLPPEKSVCRLRSNS